MSRTADCHECGSRDTSEDGFESTAAVRMQKVYRSYRTRRRLADSAVVASDEYVWRWQALDYARLNRSTVSFFNFSKPETSESALNLRASSNSHFLPFLHAVCDDLSFLQWISFFCQVLSPTEDKECSLIRKSDEIRTNPEPPKLHAPSVIEKNKPFKSSTYAQTERTRSYKRTLSCNPQVPGKSVPKKEILKRIKSKKEASSYQLGNQLSLNWSTGAGPRIGCVADYPQKLRVQALEYVNLSPMDVTTPSTSKLPAVLTSIATSCGIM